MKLRRMKFFILSFMLFPSLSNACLNGDPNCSGGYLPGAPAPLQSGGVSESNQYNIQMIMALASALSAGVAAFQNGNSHGVVPGSPALNGYVAPPYLNTDNPNDGTAQ